MERQRLGRCSLCDGSVAAPDADTMVEHMMQHHGAESEDQARNMAENYFAEIYDTPEKK
jgi:hypothetical protein